MRYIQSFQNDAAIQGAVDNNLLGHPYIALNDQTGKIDWNSKDYAPVYSAMPMTIEVISAGTINFGKDSTYASSIYDKTIEYSLDDGQNWTEYCSSGASLSIQVSVGNKIQFRTKGNDDNPYGKEVPAGTGTMRVGHTFGNSTAWFKVYGNLYSMADPTQFEEITIINVNNANFFACMFQGSSGLTDASNLIMIPNLNPGLSVQQGASGVYAYMFKDCVNLTRVPKLPAMILAEDCYARMFQGCTSLVEPPELPATTMVKYCYYGMFVGCTSLTRSPLLRALAPATGCYSYMFQGCTALITISCATTGMTTEDSSNWVSGCTTGGGVLFARHPASRTWPPSRNNSGMLSNWQANYLDVNNLDGATMKYGNGSTPKAFTQGVLSGDTYVWDFSSSPKTQVFLIYKGIFQKFDYQVCDGTSCTTQTPANNWGASGNFTVPSGMVITSAEFTPGDVPQLKLYTQAQ